MQESITLFFADISFRVADLLLFYLLAFLLPVVLPSRFSRASGGISTVLACFSFLFAASILIQTPGDTVYYARYEWIRLSTLQIDLGMLIDQTAAIMLVALTLITFLVHIYSLAYMKGEEGYARYWSHLGLFSLAMCSIILADNLLIMYLCWELVGFASYLLIGFWFKREAAALANTKAFIMNRIGDMALIIALLIVYAQFGTWDIETLRRLFPASFQIDGQWITDFNTGGIRHFAALPSAWLTILGICFFLGAAGKSAQFPLHTWLPDAMEGPTPVSSLIHAATMVAAGVYLLIRVIFMLDASASLIIAVTGCFTAFMAAATALVQNDIKKVLAWSTISQLGFMMIGIGIQAPEASFMHLVAHAFFKCLLFLAAGSVILYLKKQTSVTDPQDMRAMGGLRHRLPVTFYTCLIGSAALIGFPLFSGFLSKDALLLSAFSWAAASGNILYWLVPLTALAVIFITALYSTRLLAMVFFGSSQQAGIPFKESLLVIIPLSVLALFCLFPVFGPDPVQFNASWFIAFGGMLTGSAFLNYSIPVIAFLAGITGVFISAWFFLRKKSLIREQHFFYRLLTNSWYVDEWYRKYLVKPVGHTAAFIGLSDKKVIDPVVDAAATGSVRIAGIAGWFDTYIIDGLVNFIALLAKSIGNFIRAFQSGRIQTYLILVVLAMILLYLLAYFATI